MTGTAWYESRRFELTGTLAANDEFDFDATGELPCGNSERWYSNGPIEAVSGGQIIRGRVGYEAARCGGGSTGGVAFTTFER